jgi:hypothetical protein
VNASEGSPTSVLDRPRVPETVTDREHVTVPQQGGQVQRTAQVTARVPLGWGSHAERRLSRQVLLFFALLGLYAVGFVVLGSVVWT